MIKNGQNKTYYENGELCSIEHFKDGVQDGLSYYYHKGGFLKQKGFYKNGKLYDAIEYHQIYENDKWVDVGRIDGAYENEWNFDKMEDGYKYNIERMKKITRSRMSKWLFKERDIMFKIKFIFFSFILFGLYAGIKARKFLISKY